MARKIIAGLITTPTEMGNFIDTHDACVSHLVPTIPEFEPTIRHLVDEIFNDQQYISSDDRGEVSSYLDSIAEPLASLSSYNIAILAITTTGTIKLNNGHDIPNWKRTYFYAIPIQGYFHVQEEGQTIHHFSPTCDDAMAKLLDASLRDKQIQVYPSDQIIRDKLKGSVAWCAKCCVSERAGIYGNEVSVKMPELKITSNIVERAIKDAEILLHNSGSDSAFDRVHTILHGYLKTVCKENGISYLNDASITELFKYIRQSHPNLKNLGPMEENTTRVLRSLSSILDTLNSIRNKASLAHPNEALLDIPEATLYINTIRTIIQYLDAKLS